jgi:nitrite reductase/ring-hydroxylating ferredoxin subunit
MTSLNHDAGRTRAAEPLLMLHRLADGGFAEAEAVIDGEAESLLLYREGGRVRAWLNLCPHAGRRLDWAPGQFLRSKDGLLVCAAHGAGFELDRGECVSGPCRGQSLRAVAVEVRDGAVWLLEPGSDSQE